ncbi:MAG: tetratricopeptide repeat protein [Tangfeifania sp.]
MLKKILQSNRNSLLILLILTAICYSPVVKNEFVTFDDGVLIHNNPIITDDGVSVKEIFQSKDFTPHYKPLVFLTWRAEYQLFGENPLPFLLNNLLLHLLNTVLLFLIGLKLFPLLKTDIQNTRLFSFIIALLFAIHPIHVESVAWATERKDVLYSFFFLLGWLLYFRFLEEKKTYLLVLSVVSYALVLLSKSMGITLIALIVLTDWIYYGKFTKKIILEKIPFLVVFIGGMFIYGMLTDFGDHATGLTSTTILSASENEAFFADYPWLLKRALIVSLRLVLWILHVFIPVAYSIMYPREQVLDFVGKGILVFPFLIAGLLYLVYKWRNKNLLYVFGILFFLITISPAVAISEKGSGVFLPDRYTYIPSTGLFIAAIGLLRNIKMKRTTATFLLTAYFLLLGVKCFSQVKVWRNSESLWTNAIRLFPDFSRARNSRGYYYMKVGENEKALRDLSIAIKNDPDYYGAYNNRCNLLFSMGKYEEALADINVLVRSRPDYVKYLTTRAGILFKLNRNEEAVEMSKRAIELDPESLESHKNLAIIYFQTKRYAESLPHWQKCTELEPANARNFADMGYALLMVRQNEEALEAYNQAIKIDPELASAWYNRSFTWLRLGNKEKAKEDALQARKLGANVTDSYLRRLE